MNVVICKSRKIGLGAGRIRLRIHRALQERRLDRDRAEWLPTAWTPAALAERAQCSTAFAEKVVKGMERAGKVTSRRIRSGETLYKLADPFTSRGMVIDYGHRKAG